MFKLFRYLKKIDYFFLFLIVGLIVLQVWLELKLPDFTQQITDELDKLKFNEVPEVGNILKYGGLMLACAFGSLAGTILVGLLITWTTTKLACTIREELYNKIQGFSAQEINKFSTASLITRTTNDIRQVRMFLTFGVQSMIKAPIMAVYAIIKIIGKGWQWSVATAVAVAILVVMLVIIMCLVIPKFKKVQGYIDDVNRITRENLTGIRVIHASNAENYQNKKFEKANNVLTNTNLFTGKVLAIMGPGMGLLMSVLSLVIYWIGAYIVGPGQTEGIGVMLIFMQYSVKVIMSFIMLVVIFMMLPRAIVSAKRINEVLDTENAVKSGSYKGEMDGTASIVFKNVSFKYPDAEDYVLKDISFEATEGQTVAFIGSAGSGKSTLINLIPRFYDATEGQILIDGVDVKEYDLEFLNKKIGYVPQNGVLFSGTIKSNINFGDNNSSNETINNALEISQAKEFVEKMEKGIESPIAQGGTNVSGGQKQRLSIARAIARNPEIFIFDDSFSALDYRTDKMLRKELKTKTKSATKLIVAQRIGTIKDADKIIVLDNGKVVGQGKHNELMKTCPVYQEIALSQLSKEEL